jgi:GntR family transcriptional regulator/MocR family aminotransferase
MLLSLDRNSPLPLTRQIYQAIRDQILGGRLRSGMKLPSSRELALELNVSRNVVMIAYELLIAEGYLKGSHGSGTFVSSGLLWELPAAATIPEPVPPHDNRPPLIDFRSGFPDLESVPRSAWAKLTHRVLLDAPESVFGYDAPEGRIELREAIARHLSQTRGVACDPDRILITSGSVQGLALIAKTLLPEFRRVIVEDPTNRDIVRIFTAPGVAIAPVDCDQNGIRTDRLPIPESPALISVTPSHQFPLGGILPISRRIDLVRYARESASYILEDDYDSEIRYDGPPVAAVQGLAPDRVIYLGTFSKILFPSLRLGYLVLPPNLVGKFRAVKRLSDMHSNSVNQLALAVFLREGLLARHIGRMKKIYRRRRDCLISALQTQFGAAVRVLGTSTGIHLVAEFTELRLTREQLEEAAENGVRVYPVEPALAARPDPVNRLILGYGHLSEEQIVAGIRRLGILSAFSAPNSPKK